MRSIWNFIQYNNALPIGLFLMFGAGTAAFAASPEAQQAIYNSQDKVVSVDNTYLINADISHFNFNVQITGITEDATTYYVAYSYSTIDLVDYVWKPVTKNDTLKYSKKEMQGQDLGLAVSNQLSQFVAAQTTYLTSAQSHEKALGQTQKVVATQYSGLVGKLLNPTEKKFPGYTPVVDEVATATTSAEQIAALGYIAGEAANAAAAAHNAVTPDEPVATSTGPTPDEINALIQQRVNDILAQQAADAAAAAMAASIDATNSAPPPTSNPTPASTYTPPPASSASTPAPTPVTTTTSPPSTAPDTTATTTTTTPPPTTTTTPDSTSTSTTSTSTSNTPAPDTTTTPPAPDTAATTSTTTTSAPASDTTTAAPSTAPSNTASSTTQ